MLRYLIAGVIGFPILGCVFQGAAQSGTTSAGDLASLSDEFDDAKSLAKWKRVDVTEGWDANQLAKLAVEGGNLVLVPHTSTWYQDYRGVLVYKDVEGDFVVTAKLKVTGRDGRSAPASMFSLGGIMVRTARNDTARSWRTGNENYVFLSLGAADRPGNFQYEVKTTERSQSNLEKIPAGGSETLLKVAKIGPNLVLLRQQGSGWVVHKRYFRPDMPSSLQVGITVYTDYPTASQWGPREHNGTVITRGNPDLLARVDYMRFARPKTSGKVNLNNLSDGEIIRLLEP